MPQNLGAAFIARIRGTTTQVQVNADADKNLMVVNAGSNLPSGAAQVSGASGSVAAASAVATLAAATGKTTYITGFTVTAAGATAGLSVALAVAGLLGGTLTYVYTAPAGATVPGPVLSVQFANPIPASAVNTPITVTLPSLGTGNLAASVVATGYQL